VRRLLELILPGRLGAGYRWLVGSSWTSNLGDGIALAAGPLLVASQTRDPFLVSLAVLLQRLPWLLFGLHAGAIADRVDRKRLVIGADLARVAVLGLLCVSIATGWVGIAVVLGALFLIGVAEVFADTASGTLLPMLVGKADLGTGYARLQFGFITLNQIAGAPLGALLFAVGLAVPFGAQMACLLLAALQVSRIRLPAGPVRDAAGAHVRRDIVEGVRWLLDHKPVRTLALVIFSFNITWAASWAVLVLYSLEVLDMGPVGYGLLTTAAAVGGLVTTPCYGWLERRVPLATLMRVCLLLEVVMHLGFAVTTEPVVALAIMFGFGAYAFVWGTLSQAVRQRAVPMELQGRVGAVYGVGVFGGMVVGSGLGGLLASAWGVTAPFWVGFVGSGVLLALVWRQLAHIAHADDDVRAAEQVAG